MKIYILKFTTFLLVLAMIFFSCQCKNEPAEAILGRWELIAKGSDENSIKPVEPNGAYIEFLSEGISRSYYPEVDDFYYTMYKIDKKFIYYYSYEKPPDQAPFEYRYSISKGLLKMTFIKGGLIDWTPGGPTTIYIYQPKK